MSKYLRVEGTKIVDPDGKEVILKGAGLGGWMNMENFISGYPACEFQIREALASEIGSEKADFYFDKYLEYFFTDTDAAFFKSLGLNCIRLPFNYHHFEDDMNPRVLKKSGFKHLDRVIDICSKHGIYTVLDMHTAPGGQNPGWHSDHGTHLSQFWKHKDFQDRSLWLWAELSKHYVGNAWVAGYNPLNEPTDEEHTRLVKWYDQVYDVIRTHDPHHIIFWDGNTFAQDFTHFGDYWKKWKNSSYSLHDYSSFGFPASTEVYVGSEKQRKKLEDILDGKRQWMVERGLCAWNGEWGPVYAQESVEGDKTAEINKTRIKVLEDQLALYEKRSLSWSIWTYKDIGFQGMVYTARSTSHIKLFDSFLRKKHSLALDAWGADDTDVKSVYGPLEDLIKKNIEKEEDLEMYPRSFRSRVSTIARNILIAEFFLKEWARHFASKSFDELDELARSFHFDNCVQRKELNDALKQAAGLH